MANEIFISSALAKKVFPTATREFRVEGKFTSEDNLTGVTRQVTDRDSYIISHTDVYSWEFVIHGYYFSIQWPEGKEMKNVWAHIVVDSMGRLSAIDGSISIDVNNVFKALLFDHQQSITPPSGCSTYSLRLTNDDGSDCKDSYIKYNADNMIYQYDGQELSVGDKLTHLQNTKQDNITPTNPLNISGKDGASLVSGILDTTHGGTGINTSYIETGKTGAGYLENMKSEYAYRSVFAQYLATQPGDEEITVGTSTYPVWFNEGVPEICSDTLDNSINGNAATATNSKYAEKIGTSASHGSIGSSDRVVYVKEGVVTAGRAIYVLTTDKFPDEAEEGDILIKY